MVTKDGMRRPATRASFDRGARALGVGGLARSPETAGPSHSHSMEFGTRRLEACKRVATGAECPRLAPRQARPAPRAAIQRMQRVTSYGSVSNDVTL